MVYHIASLDFDGTLHYTGTEHECIKLLENLPDSLINVINTGRGLDILLEKVQLYFKDDYSKFVDAIEFMICNNGSDIYCKNPEGDGYEIFQEWFDYLSDQWDREAYLKQLLPTAGRLELDLYPEKYNFKFLFYFYRQNMEQAEQVGDVFRELIKDLPIKMVCAKSSQGAPEGVKKYLIEIFPQKAGKASALTFLKDYLEKNGKKVDSIASFGDNVNDTPTVIDMPLIHKWWHGCLVGNTIEPLVEKAEELKNAALGKLIIAPKAYPGPLGVRWIMEELGWLD